MYDRRIWLYATPPGLENQRADRGFCYFLLARNRLEWSYIVDTIVSEFLYQTSITYWVMP